MLFSATSMYIKQWFFYACKICGQNLHAFFGLPIIVNNTALVHISKKVRLHKITRQFCKVLHHYLLISQIFRDVWGKTSHVNVKEKHKKLNQVWSISNKLKSHTVLWPGKVLFHRRFGHIT